VFEIPIAPAFAFGWGSTLVDAGTFARTQVRPYAAKANGDQWVAGMEQVLENGRKTSGTAVRKKSSITALPKPLHPPS
jgi:hypothetical protein